MLAMHMANELLTPGVAGALMVLAALGLGVAARGTRRRFDPAYVPLMGVLGAFVFAAQMINFPILPGTSGHLGGGLLLALLLGPHAAALTMASILIVQCLIFQDGGLLALGANIINLGLVPCYVGYGVFRAAAGASPHPARAYAGIFVAALVAVTAGAALVPVQAHLSGVVAVPLRQFLLVMVGLHLLIGLVEAVITFGVIGYVGRVRPEAVQAMTGFTGARSGRVGTPALAGSFLVVALLLAGVGSLMASEWPDVLDSVTSAEAARRMVRENSDATVERVGAFQGETAPLPEYKWTSASGIIGTLVTLALVWAVGRGLRGRTTPAAPATAPNGTPVHEHHAFQHQRDAHH